MSPCGKEEPMASWAALDKVLAAGGGEVVLCLSSALLRPHLDCWVQFWDPQYRRDMEVPERAQQRTGTKMMKGLNISSVRKSWEGCLAWRRKGSGGIC